VDANGRKHEPLSEAEIGILARVLCEDDEKRAGALLLLATDIRARDGSGPDFPHYVLRQYAFSQCGNQAIDAQAELLRDEIPERFMP
jgi:hypothetical protein